MSETDKPAPLRDWAVFFGWIAGLVLIGGAVWYVTQPLRNQFLMNSVNQILARREDPRRLSAPLAGPRTRGISAPLGNWYALENSRKALFVFPLVQNGPMALCGALVSPEGKVEELFPLSGHAGHIFSDLPQGMKQIYIRRIEALGFPAAGAAHE
jgi:hypothetical protein